MVKPPWWSLPARRAAGEVVAWPDLAEDELTPAPELWPSSAPTADWAPDAALLAAAPAAAPAPEPEFPLWCDPPDEVPEGTVTGGSLGWGCETPGTVTGGTVTVGTVTVGVDTVGTETLGTETAGGPTLRALARSAAANPDMATSRKQATLTSLLTLFGITYLAVPTAVWSGVLDDPRPW